MHPHAAMVRYADLALAAIHREYPNHVVHLLQGDDDVRPPRELTPAFYGSFDWRSAVHGHWCLVRLLRFVPDASFTERARAALARSLTPKNIQGELAYMRGVGREGFERPYGLAWLLQLCAELREWRDPDARAWYAALEPLEALAVERLRVWLAKLNWPVRSGAHAQTAFSLGLAFDWCRTAADDGFSRLISSRARDWFANDVSAPIAYEPSSVDFLSPVLGEADLMRRLLPQREFAGWLDAFLPDLTGAAARRWLTPVTSPGPSDGQLAHLDGLNLSRAWMLLGIAAALAHGDPHLPLLRAAAQEHREAGVAAVTGEHYAGAHWLGTFAVYLLTERGLHGTGPQPPHGAESSVGGEQFGVGDGDGASHA